MTLGGARRDHLLEPFLEVWKLALVWRTEKREGGGGFHHELYWRMLSIVKQLGPSWKELSGYQLPADDSTVAVSGSVAWCKKLVCRKDKNKLIRRNSEATSWLIVNVQDSCWAWLKCGDWKVQSWHTFSPVLKDWRGSCKSELSGMGTHVA